MTSKIIYNPNGTQCACEYIDGESDPWWPGSGETYGRNPRTDDAFSRHQSSDGWIVHNHTFPTTPEEEQEIERRIDEHGGGGYLGCASAVSTVLDGIGPFEGLGHHWRPSSLERALKRLHK